jgi:hypothetical protein
VDGLDFAWSKPSVQAILNGGYRFVCRYLSWDTSGKNLTHAEATSYLDAGIAVVSNWEYATDAALKGYNQGVSDATEGRSQHNNCGGPEEAQIYFSVDWDVNQSQYAAVAEYFKGVATVVGLDRTGAYGGYNIIKYLFDNGLIRYGWQTYAWSGGRWDGRAQLRQVQNGIIVDGADCDRNTAMADDYGQWGGNDMSDYSPDTARAIAIGATYTGGWLPPEDDVRQYNLQTVEGRLTSLIEAGSSVPVEVDADAVAEALMSNKDFLAAIAKAVNDDAAARMASTQAGRTVPTAR